MYLHITADKVTKESGGGKAVVNELEALRSMGNTISLSFDDLSPQKFHQPDSPFLWDYFGLTKVATMPLAGDCRLVHFYSGSFTETVRNLKERCIWVSYMVPAHDRRISIEEFERLGLEYPYKHISDEGLWKMYSEGYRLADLVLTQSRRSADFMRSIGCGNVEVVPGGIDWPTKVEPMPEKFHVAYVGAIGPDKSLIDLMAAWGILNYSDSTLILAGLGTELLGPMINKFATRGNFILKGRVKDVADVYNACSVYVQPSATEGFGLEIPEAMSHGRVVVCSEGVGAADCITDGVDSFIVPIRSPDAIAERIDFLKKNRDKLISMGEKAREKAKNYTWERVKEMYIKAWRKM